MMNVIEVRVDNGLYYFKAYWSVFTGPVSTSKILGR